MRKGHDKQIPVYRCYRSSAIACAKEQILQICHSLIGQNIGYATASTPLGRYI